MKSKKTSVEIGTFQTVPDSPNGQSVRNGRFERSLFEGLKGSSNGRLSSVCTTPSLESAAHILHTKCITLGVDTLSGTPWQELLNKNSNLPNAHMLGHQIFSSPMDIVRTIWERQFVRCTHSHTLCAQIAKRSESNCVDKMIKINLFDFGLTGRWLWKG